MNNECYIIIKTDEFTVNQPFDDRDEAYKALLSFKGNYKEAMLFDSKTNLPFISLRTIL